MTPDEIKAIFSRVPFKLSMSIAGSKEHELHYGNKELSIGFTIITPKKRGQFQKAYRKYWCSAKPKTSYDTIVELGLDNPLIVQLAAATYPKPNPNIPTHT